MAIAHLTSVLDEAGARYELLAHGHAETAVAEAEALGVSPAEVAKTLIVKMPEGHLRAVVPASERLDLGKLADLYGHKRKELQLASEDELRVAYPEFELGAVPPLGGAHRDPVVVDSRLAERESVVLEAGSHEESIRLTAADVLRLTEARVADICQD